jgi:predicted O-linked N-acetylglucosamine transferase (SPINDLY family)
MKLDAALASYDEAIALKPDYAEAYFNRGSLFEELKNLESALVNYQTALNLNQEFEYLFGTIFDIKMQLCEWQNFNQNVFELSRKILSNIKATPSFSTLALPISMTEKRKAAEIWIADKYPNSTSLGPILKLQNQPKIRIGYFSADFYNHATLYLMAGLFEHHDKANFELIAFSFGPNKKDEMQKRVSQVFDKFIDVRNVSDKAVAKLSRELGIHIAVDLKGLTKDTRLGIFSYKAAPIQVSYLGFPGTLGADYIDYLIADEILIPRESQQY